MREASIVVDFDVPATMRDGVQLRANVYRPSAGRWPVLLTRLPYGKDLPLGTSVLDPTQAARRGYVVIVQDTRGRWASDGDFIPFETEGDDGFDTIAWAAELPYSDGQVGMYGASYFGFTQWSAAVKRPPALKAMVPFITWSDPLNGLAFRGGALELGTLANWGLQMGFDQYVRQHRANPAALGPAIVMLGREIDALGRSGYASLPLAAFAPLRRHPVLNAFFDRVAQPMDAASLEAVTIAGKHDQVDVPTFSVGGWYDIFLADTIANFVAMQRQDRPARLLIGPWTHGQQRNPVGELDFGVGAQIGLIDMQTDFGSLQLRWFDHWLKGIDTGLLAEAPVRLFVMGANIWRDEHEWPLTRAVPTPFYLRAGGELSTTAPESEAPDRYTYDPANPVPTHGGALLMPPEFAGGPVDQRPIEARPDVLTFTGPVLDHDVEVTGPITVQLWASSSAVDTDFVARLVDVYPDGRAFNLTDGILRARYRDAGSGDAGSGDAGSGDAGSGDAGSGDAGSGDAGSGEAESGEAESGDAGSGRAGPGRAASLLEPGRPYLFAIDLWATANVFLAGHRIRLQVTSSCFPRWDRNPNTGHEFGADAELCTAEQTILHDRAHPSHVLLPLVPA